ncbi:ATP-binding protein [Clostridium sediminicola]|uniref:ATP-binding protein n=1 Tax=Clostridium sediminicola TaxID=3114879 RepID=UPI0031F252BD
MSKKLPYGISNYKTLVEDNYIFVDKTKHIEVLENLHAPFIFFLRPRRFGKSLFTSVLENYYDINTKDDFYKLFGDTYIGKNTTKEKNNYYVLKFNFSKLDTDSKKSLEESFLRTINNSFKEFGNKYNIELNYNNKGFPASVFEDFLGDITYKIDKPLYVIIDEYDHFANELLSFKTDMFSEIISKTGFVRKWYEVLKIGTESIIKRIFATGVSPITLDSLTSGFNIASDITRDLRFNEMMGFNEEEVRALILNTSKKTLEKEKLDDLVKELRLNYNGYLFSESAETRLFNSDMILYYLKNYQDFGKGPRELIDKNIASDYGKLGYIFELKDKNKNMKVLDKVLQGEEIITAITSQFSMEKDFEEDDFKSLLFYLGMLTIKREDLGDVVLTVPNNVIRELYFDYFGKKLKEDMEYELNTTDIRNSIKSIAQKADNSELIQIVEKTLNKLSNKDYIKFDEKYVKLIFLTYCFLSKIYLVKSEYEVENGYIDIALLKQVNVEPAYFAIFELKYISKKEYEDKGSLIVKEKLDEAIIQLQKYKNSYELNNIENLKKWAIVFVGDKCVVNKEI